MTNKELNKRINRGFIQLTFLFVAFGIIILLQSLEKSANSPKKLQDQRSISRDTCVLSSLDSLRIEVYRLKIAFPEIFIKQVVLESDWMSSFLYRNNNNVCGMTLAARRPTVAIGKANNHAVYLRWQDSVMDYLLWQLYNGSYFCKTEEEYLQRLKSSNYAADSNYINKLR